MFCTFLGNMGLYTHRINQNTFSKLWNIIVAFLFVFSIECFCFYFSLNLPPSCPRTTFILKADNRWQDWGTCQTFSSYTAEARKLMEVIKALLLMPRKEPRNKAFPLTCDWSDFPVCIAEVTRVSGLMLTSVSSWEVFKTFLVLG